MTKLEELIEKLCPDGVEYVKLGDVCDIKGRIGFRGYTRQDQVEQGNGAISLSPSNIVDGNIVYDNCTYITWEKYEESPEIKANTGDIIFCKTASVGKTALIKELPEKATINPQLVLINNIKCNNSFLSYVLKGKDFQNKVSKIKGLGTIPTISQKDFYNLTIPLPPLPVQEEIVRILDKFTTLTAELQAELQARKIQYDEISYRLLRVNKEYSIYTISEICNLNKGKTAIQKSIAGKYPLVVTTTERKSCDSYQFEQPTVCIPLVSSRGHGVASLNHVYYQEGKFALGNILCGVTPKDSALVSAKYLYYYFECTKDYTLVPLMKGGANVSMTVSDIEKVKIPVPSIEEQNKIIEMLEKFEEYCDSLLPAEIEARRKQYEYYRDKLLTFKRKE